MHLKLPRYNSSTNSTGGLLFVDGLFHCFTCEDEHRDIKIHGETRIPAGTYEIKLRTQGGMTKRYAKKFDFHQGMLWLQDVPGFDWIYIHIGNNEKHTDGCILVGFGANCKNGNTVQHSTLAYTDLYLMVVEAINSGERVFIEIVNQV